MNNAILKKIIFNHYKLVPIDLIKIKNVYKIICSDNEKYCLKVINYNLNHVDFMMNIMVHLHKNNFSNTPSIIKTLENGNYINLGNKYAYLTKWIESREANYNKIEDVKNVASKLAEFHLKSRGFGFNFSPRNKWGKWDLIFYKKLKDIEKFKEIIKNKEVKDTFDGIYESGIDRHINSAKEAIKNLLSSKYKELMEKEKKFKGFCHHDIANHNVLINETNNIYFIDFDYCILDSYLHDITSLILRTSKYGKWNLRRTTEILDSYAAVNKIHGNETQVMAAFMEFPEDFWQIGLQYYIEKQPYSMEFYLKKLDKIMRDNFEKLVFLGEFRKINLER